MKNSAIKSTIISLLVFCYSPLFSQVLPAKDFNKAVREADNYYYYDIDYEKAASKYEYLVNIYPDNCNLAAKLGICYLNLDGRKAEAMKLLDKASSDVVTNDKEYKEYGEKAPLDTYLYRAIAYQKNDSLRQAITLFYEAKKRLAGTQTYREEYIDNQIRDCRYAMEMKKKPLTIITKLFAPWLNEYPGACNPVLSKNDSVFVFTVKKGIQTRILCSYKSGSWKRPVDITNQLGGYDRFYSNSITGDGNQLIISMDDGGDGNLYYSTRHDTTWTKIKSIGRPVNTIYWESDGFITPDGSTLYFASNRPGGEGGFDIWSSKKLRNGIWSEPVNCGNVINTPYDEGTPFFDVKTGTLLFSSNGFISIGGSDIFRSANRNGVWSNPTGLPYAFNTVDDNVFFIINNNTPGFVTSFYNKNNNARNIYSVVALDPADKITTAIGSVSLQDGMSIDPKQIKIVLSDLKKGTKLKEIDMIDTSSFKFDIVPGDYQIFVSLQGYKTDTINLNVPLYFPGNYISVNSSLEPEKVSTGDFLSIKNILFEFDSYKLNDQALLNLEILKSILVNYPELTIEIAGYTDAKGSTVYNNKLADNRAQAVIDYLTSSGISSARFVKKSFGKSNFVAINRNSDGSDNPEGRAYNRRVTFGIVNPQTGLVIRQETYAPERFQNPNSLKYSIVLLRTKEILNPGYFSGLIKNEMLFIRTIKLDTVSLYVLGVFYNKADAEKYLGYVREKGLDKAYILNQYDLVDVSKSILNPDAKESVNQSNQLMYTLQLMSTRNRLNIHLVFAGLEGVTEFRTADGMYKYLYGEYETLAKAREALLLIKKSGYGDAFIKQIDGQDLK
jgi:outer membrane protein OmpA-like peptidoglycan-associated protein/tetratricopeptide (TPR) repeat protein